MKNIDSYTHTRGESIYLDDIAIVYGTLYAACYDSTVAHGKLISIDTTEAENCEGVVRIITYKDITGENQIGGIIQDEPLLAEHEVHFCGMPIALVLAESDKEARQALKKIKVVIDKTAILHLENI
jgi:xanthine dehydrogenase large subunit